MALMLIEYAIILLWLAESSVLGIEECKESVTNIAKELMELFLSVEFVALIQCGIIVSNMFEDFGIEVIA